MIVLLLVGSLAFTNSKSENIVDMTIEEFMNKPFSKVTKSDMKNYVSDLWYYATSVVGPVMDDSIKYIKQDIIIESDTLDIMLSWVIANKAGNQDIWIYTKGKDDKTFHKIQFFTKLDSLQRNKLINAVWSATIAIQAEMFEVLEPGYMKIYPIINFESLNLYASAD